MRPAYEVALVSSDFGAYTGQVLLRIAKRTLVLGTLGAALLAQPALAAPTVTGEFAIASEFDDNSKIVEGPDGNLWLTVNGAGKDVAKITPAGAVTEYNIEAIAPQGIAAANGKLWVTAFGAVVSFDPANPEGTKAPISVPQNATFHSIVLGADGNLWIADEGNLVRLNPTTKATKPFPVTNLAPRDIDVYGSGLVIADFGESRILTATTSDPPVVKEFKLGGGTQGVAGGPNGQIAFSEPGGTPEAYGLLTPPGPAQLTTSPTDPFGVVLGQDGAYWIAQATTSSLARVTTGNVSTQLTGFAPGSEPRQLTTGPSNTLWVTLPKTKKVARVSGLEPPVSPVTPILTPAKTVPDTKIDKGPKGVVKTRHKRAKVKFRFSSDTTGASFECRLMRLPSKRRKGGKIPKIARVLPFAGCSSPAKYRLRPGRYVFEARAVLKGIADLTPAKRSFRVVRLHRR